jgi:hypothetical protein
VLNKVDTKAKEVKSFQTYNWYGCKEETVTGVFLKTEGAKRVINRKFKIIMADIRVGNRVLSRYIRV